MPNKIENDDMEKKIITLITPEGDEVECEVLLFFELDSTHKQYLVYTYNEKDKNGMVTVYASTATKKEDGYHLSSIDTEQEWEEIKEVMRKIIKSGGDE